MKRMYFFCATLSMMSLGASAQVALPLSVDEDVFNADTIFIEKTRVEWNSSTNAVKTQNFQDGGYAVFKFKDTPGMLHLDYQRTSYGKNRVMMIQESPDAQNFSDLYNGDPSTSWTTLASKLKKDTRYIKLYYDAKYTFGDVGSRMGYWRDINVTEPIAAQAKADTLDVNYGAKELKTISVSYSNPSGDIVVSSSDSHIFFGQEGSSTFTIANVAGTEGKATVDVYYDSSLEPVATGELSSVLTVADSGNEGYAKEYKLVARVKAPIVLSETEGSITTVVGQEATKTFRVDHLSSISPDNISIVSSREDVAVSVEPSAETENVLDVTLRYLPQEVADNAESKITVSESTSGLSLDYKLTVNAYSANNIIANVAEYNKFAEIVNAGFNVNAELSDDIEFSADEPNVQIESFAGVFDGKFHKITGYGVADEKALFGNSTSLTGTVKNLCVENVALLDANVEGLDENGNGLAVEYCYGTPSDTEKAQLMNYVYMNTDKVKNCFTRVRSEEVDPSTGVGSPVYLYKLNEGSLGMVEADMTTTDGMPACFSLWKQMESSSPSVFGFKIGADEMPSFLTADNAVGTANYYTNEANATGKTIYVQGGQLYDENLAAFSFEGKKNDFVVLNEDSETLGGEGLKALPDNTVTKDGKARKIVITDGEDYRFPVNTSLQEISADSIEYSRLVRFNSYNESFCLPFDVISCGDDSNGSHIDYIFVDPSKQALIEDKDEITLQSTINYRDYNADKYGSVIPAGTPFYAYCCEVLPTDGTVSDTKESVAIFVGENVSLKNDVEGAVGKFAPLFGTYVNSTVADFDSDDLLTYVLTDAEDNTDGLGDFVRPTASDYRVMAFRVYALLDKSVSENGLKSYKMVVDDGKTSGIKIIDNENAQSASAIYDIMGRRVTKMTDGNIYMQNGRKFVFMAK